MPKKGDALESTQGDNRNAVKRLVLACLLVVTGLAAALTLLPGRTGAGTSGNTPERRCADGSGSCQVDVYAGQSPQEAEVALAEKHIPVVHLKQQTGRCDTNGEAFYPTAVDIVFDSEAVRLFDADGKLVMTGAGVADIAGLGEGTYLDFPGDPQHPGCRYESDFKTLAAEFGALVYARLAREEGYEELALQYWFFYYFNDFNNTHEGDWEYIQLIFDAATAEEALAMEPTRVSFSQHAGGEKANWNSSKLSKEGSRPVVYVAKGSHANQYRQRNHLGKGQNGSGFGCDDATGPSVRVDPAVVVLPSNVGDAQGDLAWLTFKGNWGELKKGYFDGPTGPGEKKLWSNPISTVEDQRDSSVKVPEQTIGPSAADAFCDVVAWSSSQLFQRGPYVFMAMVLGAVGTIGLTSRRTRFTPVVSVPLRARRRFGQILRAALRIERENWRIFLGIGALFVPIGLLTTAVQQVLMTATPVKPAVEVFNDSGFNIGVALAAGVLQFGLAYWLVINASIAALHRMQEGAQPSVAEAYHIVLSRLKDLALARYAKVLLIVVLSLSVLGLPLALYLAVRWTFVEQVVMIEGASYHGSGGRSASVVRATPLKGAGGAIAIVALGAGLGPFVGGLLVLVTPWSLTFLNIVSATLYTALIPFVGIGLTLLYYDLKLKQEGRGA